MSDKQQTDGYTRSCTVCDRTFDASETGVFIEEWEMAFCDDHTEQFLSRCGIDAASAMSPPFGSAKQDPDDPDVPDDIADLTEAMGSEYPPTNPMVIMRCAAWWYMNGKGGNDPIFRWCIYWLEYVVLDQEGAPAPSQLLSDYNDRIDSISI